MGNLNELHKEFCKSYPELHISLAKFQQLRPPYCILAGKKGSHNVCVCKFHQNLRLKYSGMKQTLLKNGIHFDQSYRDTFNEMVCEEPQPDCFLINCKNCPGVENSIEKIASLFKKARIAEVSCTQWLTVDR